jgi:hypothetical protein
MHAEELRHGKNHARIPRENSKCSKDQVKKDRGDEEHGQLGIPLSRIDIHSTALST